MITTQRPVLGFFFALTTAMTWGSLAPVLKLALRELDTQTIVWSRFTVATLGLFFILQAVGKLPKSANFRGAWCLIAVGVIGLLGNFLLFNSSLIYIPPTTTQMLAQIAPFVMMFASVLIFKEQFGLHQKIGILLLIIGFVLFFNERLGELLSGSGSYAFGVMLAFCGSAIWAAYGVAQKLLLKTFSAQQILLIIYAGCALVLTPTAHFDSIVELSWVGACALAYCCLNTLIGYGAYAEAVRHWEQSKVSAITTLVPILTIVSAYIYHYCAPALFDAPDLNLIGYIGAFVIVFGAIFSAIGHKLLLRLKGAR